MFKVVAVTVNFERTRDKKLDEAVEAVKGCALRGEKVRDIE